jgi:pantoate--beta-alanine ligase
LLLLKTPAEVRQWRKTLDAKVTVGFVPTMGALHAGHLNLMHESLTVCDQTIASIFVHPLQFGPKEDLTQYPRPFEEDVRLLTEAGVNALFAPEASSFYEATHSTYVDVKGLDRYLCGASRPGHFQGVCTVVLKLFHLVECHHSFFGQKDIQQALILRRMIRDLSLNQEMHIIDTVREESGLAMSSRNRYLEPGEKFRASALSRGLFAAGAAFAAGEKNSERLKDLVRKHVLSAYPTRIDYIELVDQDELKPLPMADRPSVIALAIYFGRTRLIDNLLLG